jgi:hypothetical protein
MSIVKWMFPWDFTGRIATKKRRISPRNLGNVIFLRMLVMAGTLTRTAVCYNLFSPGINAISA